MIVLFKTVSTDRADDITECYVRVDGVRKDITPRQFRYYLSGAKSRDWCSVAGELFTYHAVQLGY